MTSPIEQALCAAEGAATAARELITFVRNGALDPEDLITEETVETLAHALATTIRLADPACTDEAKRQLLGALERYLEGWES